MPSGRVVLASASPRRHAILRALGVTFDSVAVNVDEEPLSAERPDRLADRLARAKAEAGALAHAGRIAIGADTVVALDGRSLGKPGGVEEARDMLRALRGRQHCVITAVAAARFLRSLEVWSESAVSAVSMRDYSEAEIEEYIASGDPFDKAGGYAIQHAGFHPVRRVEGCILNVIGLPLAELRSVLARAGYIVPSPDPSTLLSVCPACPELGRFSL